MRRVSRAGISLLEVMAALVVVSLILVPTTNLMIQALKGETTRGKRAELLHLAQGKQAEFCHLTRVSFQSRNEQGDFASMGHGDVRYTISSSDSSSQAGIPGRLQAIEILAWYDEDADRAVDDAETRVRLWTSVARATP